MDCRWRGARSTMARGGGRDTRATRESESARETSEREADSEKPPDPPLPVARVLALFSLDSKGISLSDEEEEDGRFTHRRARPRIGEESCSQHQRSGSDGTGVAALPT